jgi:hypothetical protein
VWEVFGEVNVPLLQWGNGQSLGSSFAYRSSNYSQSGRQNSWKIGLDGQLFSTLRWRATKSSDIREPNFAEIFLTGTGGGAVNDPFRGGENNSGLTAPSRPNNTLKPEIASTITSGFVWQPNFVDWISGLSLSVDWYEINLKDAITTYGIQRIVDDCHDTGAASACDLIVRLPPTDSRPGLISLIQNLNINAAMAQTRGVDFEAGYRFEPDFFRDEKESFTLRALLGYLGENSTTTAAGTTVDQAQSQTRPRYTGVVTGTYGVGAWSAMVQARYFDHVKNNITWESGRDIDNNWIASQTVISSSIAYRGEKLQSGITWRASFNVTNLFNRDPSIVPGAGGQSMIAGQDQLGRRYQVSLDLDF